MSKILVLKNCKLVPELTEGYNNPLADIVIEEEKIKEILPVGLINYENAKTIDVANQVVIPGFFDLHCHIMWKDQNYDSLVLRDQNTYLIDCIEYAQYYLKMGYTTIRDCGAAYYANVAVRDAIKKKVIEGPRIISSGKCLTPTAVGNKSWGVLYGIVDNPSDMLRVVRQEMEMGCDFIKYMITGAVLNEGGLPGAMITTQAEINALVQAADSVGTYVAAHCHGKEGIFAAVSGGVRTIEHASYMDEECAEMILKRGNYQSIIPTMSITYTLENGLHPNIKPEFVTKARDAVKHAGQAIRIAKEAGIAVGWGTDLDMEYAIRFPGLEFVARSAVGFNNLELLKQATIDSARIIGMENELGTIKTGKKADFVIYKGDPLHNISDLKVLPQMVMKEGIMLYNY